MNDETDFSNHPKSITELREDKRTFTRFYQKSANNFELIGLIEEGKNYIQHSD